MPARHFFLKLTVGRFTFPESLVCGIFWKKIVAGKKGWSWGECSCVMKIMKGMKCALAALLVVGLSGCERSEKAGDIREYEVRGIVRAPVSAEGELVIEHEDIAGLMPSMTMPFKLENTAEGADFHVGDGVTFTLTLGDKSSRISKLGRVAPDSVKLPAPAPRSAPGGASPQRLKEGDPSPEFELVDQGGRAIHAKDFSGKLLLLDFIFTRCAVPNYCPLMTSNFAEIAAALKAEGAEDRVQLLSISFDPFDTPDVLRQYAEAKGAGWTFATGNPEEIDRLTRAFAVRVEEEGGTLNHTLCTALLGPDGRILQVWRGNTWKPQEVVEAIRPALPTPPQN